MRAKQSKLTFDFEMNTTKLSVVAIVLVAVIGVSVLFLWPSMPTMSERGNEAATALLSATNRKDENAILAVEAKVQEWVSQDSLPKADEEILLGIISLAKAKEWESANAKARKLKEAQIVEQP